MIKNFLKLFYLSSSLIILAIPTYIYAASPTATPSATPKVSATPTNLEDKIKNLVKENLSATESNLKESINLKSLVGYVGAIKTISAGNISIESDQNIFQVSTTDKTAITKSGTTGKISSLAITDKVIVIGNLVKEDIIQAKMIKVIPEETDIVETNAVIANIYSIDIKKKTLVLTINKVQMPFTLSKKNTVKLEELKPNQNIFAITKKYQGKDSLTRAKIL